MSNQRGESLVMVMVAVAVAGVVVVGITTFLNQTQKAVKTLETRNEAMDLVAEIKSVSAATPACRLNFFNQLLPPIDSALTLDRFRLVDAAGTGLTNADVARRDQRLPLGSVIAAMELIPRTLAPPSTYLSDFRLTFNNTGAYTPTITRIIRTRVAVNAGGRITDCTFEDAAAGGGGGGVLRDCTTAPPLINNVDSVTLPAPSGTMAIEWCPIGSAGLGSRYLCLDSQWVQTQGASCGSTDSGGP